MAAARVWNSLNNFLLTRNHGFRYRDGYCVLMVVVYSRPSYDTLRFFIVVVDDDDDDDDVVDDHDDLDLDSIYLEVLCFMYIN